MNRENEIKQLLSTTVNKPQYNGWSNRTTYGYHSYNIEDINITGQRRPAIRIKEFQNHIDFKDKVVLDFGCNVGAMLHHLEDIKLGIGIDYDKNCIDVANRISRIIKRNNLHFFTHDFDRNEYSTLKNIISQKPDIIFLLNLGSWVKSWRDLYSLCCDYNCKILLEINNVQEGHEQIIFFEERGFKIELIVNNSLDDCTGNNLRKTFLIER